MSRRPLLLVATRNRGKLRELEALLFSTGVELRGLDDVANPPFVEESGLTYLTNAELKARALAQHANMPALADDSGLEVDALNGAPGIRSGRFAGEHASDADNIALLLKRLHGVPPQQRTARFRAVIVVAHPDRGGIFAEGTCEGLITAAPSGDAGFGYDPIFYYPPLERTFAQLAAKTKNRISHRGQACQRLAPLLPALLD